ncbi:MAG: branched-chain amino acid ABC transporter permease [Acidimicrobiales bacterium]
MALAQVIVSGILIGGIYSLVSIGLTLIWGILDVIDFAHGSYVMLGMYVAYFAWSIFGLDPLAAIPIDAVVLGIGGYLTYRIVIRPVMGKSSLAQIVITFGLLVLLEGGAELLWTPNSKGISNPVSWHLNAGIGGVVLGGPQLIGFVGAVFFTALLAVFINFTKTGNALRATGEDRVGAALMGINVERMNVLSWVLGLGCTGIAGALLMNSYTVSPLAGVVFGLIAFIAVALGGFGSVVGAGIAGLLLGVVQNVVGLYASQYSLVALVGIFLVVILIRPRGILGVR